MIVNIRGTSGSGKTTVIKKLMEFGSYEPILQTVGQYIVPRPAGYRLQLVGLHKLIYVMGQYETPTGGADNIGNLHSVFRQVKQYHDAGHHVIFEGLLISRSKGRMIDLHDKVGSENMFLLHLDTPLEQCLRSIQERRARRNNLKPVDPEQTTATFNRVLQISHSLKENGQPFRFVSREEAVGVVLEAFYSSQGSDNVRANTTAST